MPPSSVTTSAHKRLHVRAGTELEQYDWLRANLVPTLGLRFGEWRMMRHTSQRAQFRAWITDRVEFQGRYGPPVVVRPGVIRMLQSSPELTAEVLAAGPSDPPARPPAGTRRPWSRS